MRTTGRTAWWWRRAGRIAWAALTVVVVETIVLGAAVLPAMAFVTWQGTWALPAWQRLALGALGVVPLYLLGALLLMICTAGATRLLGWRTPDGVEEPLMDGSWAVPAGTPRLADGYFTELVDRLDAQHPSAGFELSQWGVYPG